MLSMLSLFLFTNHTEHVHEVQYATRYCDSVAEFPSKTITV